MAERVGDEIHHTFYTGCPFKTLSPHVATAATLYAHYKNGFLLCEGGVQDQPQEYLEAMLALDRAYNRLKIERHEEQVAEAKRQSLQRRGHRR